MKPLLTHTCAHRREERTKDEIYLKDVEIKNPKKGCKFQCMFKFIHSKS